MRSGPDDFSATVRELTEADVTELVEVSHRATALFETWNLSLPPDDPERTVRAAQRVLVVGLPVVGFVSTETLDGAAHIGELAVDPAHGRQGLGSLLLEAAVAGAVDTGRPALTLTTFRDIPWNAPWYRRRGFVEFPRDQWGPELREQWEAEHAAGIDLAPRIAMRRAL